MNFDLAFMVFFALSGIGWLALFLFPRNRFVNWWLCGTILPALIALFYTLLCVIYWNTHEASFLERFGSLHGILSMFSVSKGLLLAGYVHYLCFDLFIGAWQARRATVLRVPYLLLLPCLVLTLLFGPTGLILFQVILMARGQYRPENELQP